MTCIVSSIDRYADPAWSNSSYKREVGNPNPTSTLPLFLTQSCKPTTSHRHDLHLPQSTLLTQVATGNLRLPRPRCTPHLRFGCGKAPHRAVYTGPPANRYVDRQLPGGTA
ncbi:hypothetical protein B296_00057716 [Ensete ventricosum]|uniref:Uncharacterized protein n=1 Tax=Ensete ventricosum TaxID=4639 RepID=A0A426X2N0_ENSVE|nr:hypothetical protein B296_00057716 [Ensete ventricosum]